MAVQAHTPGTLSMREAVYYALSLPVSTIIIGCDSIAQLEENVTLAREYTPLSGTRWRRCTAEQKRFRSSHCSSASTITSNCGFTTEAQSSRAFGRDLLFPFPSSVATLLGLG